MYMLPEELEALPRQPRPFYLDIGDRVVKYQDGGQVLWEDFGEDNYDAVK